VGIELIRALTSVSRPLIERDFHLADGWCEGEISGRFRGA
jgi:hypothetical protein